MRRSSQNFFPHPLLEHVEHQRTESRLLMHQLHISLNFDWIYMYWPRWTNTFNLLIGPRRMRMMIAKCSSTREHQQQMPSVMHQTITAKLFTSEKKTYFITIVIKLISFPSPLCFLHILLLLVKVLLVRLICKTVSSHPTYQFKSAGRNRVCYPYSFLYMCFYLCLNLGMQTSNIQVN